MNRLVSIAGSACAAVVLAAGCAAKYEPSKGDSARVRFVVSANTLQATALYTERSCIAANDMSGIQTVASFSKTMPLGMKLSPGNRVGIPDADRYAAQLSTETMLRTDKEVTIGYSAVIGEYTTAGYGITRHSTVCTLGLTFLPAPDQDYQVDFGHDGVACSIGLRRLDRASGRWVSENNLVKQAPNCPA